MPTEFPVIFWCPFDMKKKRRGRKKKQGRGYEYYSKNGL
jgi:hypothetical protein